MKKYLILLLLLIPINVSAQVVNHNILYQFNNLTDAQINTAASKKLVFFDESVGDNISAGLDCLAVSYNIAPSRCKRWTQPSGFNSPVDSWSKIYNRYNWNYYFLGTTIPCNNKSYWYNQLQCFIDFVDNHSEYYVYIWMPSYLVVADGSDIASPTTGFFTQQPNRPDYSDLLSLRTRHPDKKIGIATSSLARGIGTSVSTSFNDRLRNDTNGLLFIDVADIESYDPSGYPWYDNRDGIPYVVNGNILENYPDDGFNYPAIASHYTSEVNGGHLGSPSAGMIRLAKAMWLMMVNQ